MRPNPTFGSSVVCVSSHLSVLLFLLAAACCLYLCCLLAPRLQLPRCRTALAPIRSSFLSLPGSCVFVFFFFTRFTLRLAADLFSGELTNQKSGTVLLAKQARPRTTHWQIHGWATGSHIGEPTWGSHLGSHWQVRQVAGGQQALGGGQVLRFAESNLYVG